jgi:regulator of sirC expression with transglutaminase-like and TPR domain
MQEMDRRKEEFAEKREEIRGSVEGYALETYAHKLVETLQNAIMHRNPPKEQIEN